MDNDSGERKGLCVFEGRVGFKDFVHDFKNVENSRGINRIKDVFVVDL